MFIKKYFTNPSPSPLFTGRDLFHLIVPFIGGFILTLLVGMLDTAMVSTVSEEAVSGVSLVDNMTQLVIFVLNAFAMGGAVVAGQYLGNKDPEQACRCVSQLLFLAGSFAFAAAIVIFLVRQPLISLFFGSITTEVNREAMIYLTITVFSIPGMALYESSMAAFRAMGEAKITMYVSLVMNLINVIGNALLIFVFHMGTAGVAWPTLVSRWAAAFIGLALLTNQRRPLHLQLQDHFRVRKDLIGKILKVGLPNGIENGVFQLGKLMVLSLITGFGTQAIAANAVAVILTNILSVPGWGINQTNMTVISRCVGANEYDQARFYNFLLNLLSSGIILVWGSLIVLSLPLILPMFSLSAEALSIARTMIIIHAVGSVLFWSMAFLTPTSMRAAGDASFAMVISIVSMWVFRVGFAWIMCHTWDLGLGAGCVWLAMVTDWIFRAAVYTVYWKQGRWMTKRVV